MISNNTTYYVQEIIMKKGNDLLDKIKYPKDLRKLNDKQLKTVAKS